MFRWFLLACLGASVALADTDARACGGCFHPPNPPPAERSVVTGHRMAFSISTTETVLWDQITYSGNPREFAWVLPVKPGAVIQASRDEWFAALDAATQPVISAPVSSVPLQGCAMVGCAASGGADNGAGGGSGGSVQVLAQGVVGPYDTVTLQSSNPNALADWLTSHSFDIPASIQPTIAYYVGGGFDFIAVRLRPECGVSAMEPVRIVTPGADPTLPLRMVAVGAGSKVDLVLWILGEGRWQPQNFPSVTIDDTQLTWDNSQELSNYQALSQSLMAQNGGRTWLTEYAQAIEPSAYGAQFSAANPTLNQAYYAFCGGAGPSNGSTVVRPPPCAHTGAVDASFEAGDDASEAGDEGDAGEAGEAGEAPEAGDAAEASDSGDAGVASEAGDDARAEAGGAEAGRDDAGDSASPTDPCQAFDDLNVAMIGIDPTNVWLTRIRASLPLDALATDLVLAAGPQTQVSNLHQVTAAPDAGSAPNQTSEGSCETGAQRREASGTVTLLVLTCAGLTAIFRRRRTQRR
jgi:hypothetical protein